jgi:hypothetical protein
MPATVITSTTQETIMSMTGNKNQNFLPDENENDEPERELEQEPEEGGGHVGGHVPSTSTEPRIKNN